MKAPQRIVSLVPSLSEALFVLGAGARVVGVTDWCVHPAEAVAGLPKLGGTKDPDVEAIAALRPDLIIANQEENTLRAVSALRRRGLEVWVTYPRTVAEGAALFVELAERCGVAQRPDARRAIADVRDTVASAEQALAARSTPCPRVFCPIWRDPWMAVAADTYIHDIIRLSGGANVFAERGDRRYPIVELADVEAARPEVVLLPSEPYAFGPRDVAEIAALDTPASESGRIHMIDGTWVSWYGPRIGLAVRALRELILC